MAACDNPLGWDVEFVTCIPVTGAPATGTMSLTDEKWCVTNESKFSPPPIRRVVSASMLYDGSHIHGSVFDDRVLELRLVCEADDADDLATEIQKLMRQLAKESNILMVRPSTTEAVYFRTHRVTPEEVIIALRHQRHAYISVDVLAEPFAYGPEEIVGSRWINFNPAIVTGTGLSSSSPNGMFFDVSGVKGDVAAPTRIVTDDAITNGITYAIASRRRGDPSQVPFLLQTESTTMFIDTTVTADAAASGGSGTLTTYTTFPDLDDRFGGNWPVTSSATKGKSDWRGRYRVFLRAKHSAASATLQFQLRYDGIDDGAPDIYNDMVTKVTTGTSWFMIDLGEVQLPLGQDVPIDGPSGCETAAGNLNFNVQMGRVLGTGSTTTDYMIFVPIDERYATLLAGSDVFPNEYVMDSFNDVFYGRTRGSDGVWAVQSQADFVGLGLLPELLPGETNRFYFFQISSQNLISSSAREFQISYWPRYLRVRPVST